MNITASQLSGEHLGQQLSLTGRATEYQGHLTKVTHYDGEAAIQIRTSWGLQGMTVPGSTAITIQESR